MKHLGKKILIGMAGVVGSTAMAADFDGGEPLMCAFGQVIECVDGSECVVVTHESVDAPDFVKLDFKRKQYSAITAGQEGESDALDNIVNVVDHLIVQGVQGTTSGDSLGWSMSINHNTGQMVVTGSGENAGFVIFGACTPM